MNVDLLRHYVHRMFLEKSSFVNFMKLKTGISLPKSYTFKVLIERALSQLGEEKLLEALALDDQNEALEKMDLIPLLVALEKSDLFELSGRLAIHVDQKMNRGDLTRAILAGSKLGRLMPTLKNLAKEKFIIEVNYEGRVIGPLGITYLTPDETIGSAHAFLLLFRYMDPKLIDTIGAKVNKKEQTPAETSQRILSEMGMSKTLPILSNMILSHEVEVNKLNLSPSMRVDEKYGITYPIRTPVERLAKFLCDQFTEKDLQSHLKSGYKSYEEKVLAYCIEDTPLNIIETLMGEPQLRKSLINMFGIDGVHLPSIKRELINMVLFRMGFFIPTSPKGLATYTDHMKRYRQSFDRSSSPETVIGLATSAFVETEALLKDMIFFFGTHIRHEEGEPLQKRKWYLADVEKEILTACYGKRRVDPIEKTNFGSLVSILRHMEKRVKKDPEISSKIQNFFGRKTLLDTEGRIVQLLDSLSPYRKFYVHDTPKQESAKIEDARVVLDLMKELAQALKGIYPMVVFGCRIITDNFGRTYLVAENELDEEYTIYVNEYLGFEVLQHEHLIKDSTSPIIVNPLIIFRP